jgi:acetylcholinesterase
MHADEIAFVFGQPLNLSYQYTQKEVALSKQMMSYWANFAKTGNPSLTGSGRWTDTYWPLHTPLQREILTLSAEPSKILEGHRVRKCAFWKKFLPQLAQDNAGAKRPSGCGAHCCSSGASSSSSRSSILITAPLLLLLLLNTLIKLTPNSPNLIN